MSRSTFQVPQVPGGPKTPIIFPKVPIIPQSPLIIPLVPTLPTISRQVIKVIPLGAMGTLPPTIPKAPPALPIGRRGAGKLAVLPPPTVRPFPLTPVPGLAPTYENAFRNLNFGAVSAKTKEIYESPVRRLLLIKYLFNSGGYYQVLVENPSLGAQTPLRYYLGLQGSPDCLQAPHIMEEFLRIGDPGTQWRTLEEVYMEAQ